MPEKFPWRVWLTVRRRIRAVPVPAARAGQSCDPIQPSNNSVKFQLPGTESPGLFEVTVQSGSGTSKPVLLNRPELWFLQPVQLQPGLDAKSGAARRVGANHWQEFSAARRSGPPRARCYAADGRWISLAVTNVERFSLRAQLPSELAEGRYELWIHNGFGGGAAGAGRWRWKSKNRTRGRTKFST